MNGLFYAALLLVCALSSVAVYYHILLYRRKKALVSAQVQIDAELAKRRERNKKSIEIIARALLENQVTLTEASIRINALLQSLALDAKTQEALTVFGQLAEATAHIPILDKWKALSKKQKQAYDLEREGIESRFQDFVVSAAKKISQEKILDIAENNTIS